MAYNAEDIENVMLADDVELSAQSPVTCLQCLSAARSGGLP
jgi:hypothetical protein